MRRAVLRAGLCCTTPHHTTRHHIARHHTTPHHTTPHHTARHDTTPRRHLSFAETERAMPLHKSDRQSPRSGQGAGAVLSRPQRTALPGGLADAVLEALPNCMAVLDHVGTIVAGNTSWRRFARENRAPDLAEGPIRLDYPAGFRPRTRPSSAPAA